MTDGSARSDRRWRVDPPERPAEGRALRPTAKVRARRVVSAVRVEESSEASRSTGRIERVALSDSANAAGSEFERDRAPQRWNDDLAGSTLTDRLDAHARSLGQALIARQAEIDRREADVHARLAELDSMRRELELWSAGERSKLAEVRAELAERSARLDADAIERRRELDRREGALADSLVAVERAQAKIEELQRRCEEAMRRFDSDAKADREATKTASGEASRGGLRVIHVDAHTGRRIASAKRSIETREPAASETAAPKAERGKAPQPPTTNDLIRLHEALLDKERYLADEARKLERERKAFAELRMNWIEERLNQDRKLEAGEAMAELRSIRAEIEQDRLGRVQVQKRRHQRMQHLLEAIEDEVTRLDIAWASVPQR